VQAAWPLAGWDVPGGHRAQSALPLPAAKVPAAHSWHSALPESENRPEAQAKQLAAPSCGWKKPGAQ